MTSIKSLRTNYPLIMIQGIVDLLNRKVDNNDDDNTLFKICGESRLSESENELIDASEREEMLDKASKNMKNPLGEPKPKETCHNLVPFTDQSDITEKANDEKPICTYKEHIRCHSLSKEHVLNWPVSNDGEVKMFVPVKKGKNFILLSSSETKNIVHELHVIYEPMKNKRFIRPIYIICEGSNGKFEAPCGEDNSIESAVERISFNARILQTFTGENLNSHGFGRNSFRLEEDDEGNVKVHVFRSKLNIEKAHQMTGDELYRYFKQELAKSELFNPLCKFWVFMSCTCYSPPAEKEEFDKKKIAEYLKGHTALGGDNLALFGTGCLHTWARNLEELVTRFTDERKIDCTSLFDDSCNRGFHWANYSTTLGAAMHELGHTFNLPHTPSGIMGRGFDDINCFFTCQKNGMYLLKTDAVNSPYGNFGAHWHRSSAVILNYCRWTGNRNDDTDDAIACPTMSSEACNIGPVGGGCKRDKDMLSFDLKNWLGDEKLNFGGMRVKAGEFVDAIQFIGSKHNEQECFEEVLSPWFGNENSDSRVYEFRFNGEDEKLTALDVRAGEWIDAMRIHSTQKSSVWIGGNGGDLYKLAPSDANTNVSGLFGTADHFVTSIGINISSCKQEQQDSLHNRFYFQSAYGIRVIEAQCKDGEVLKHWEFIEKTPQNFLSILKNDILLAGKTQTVAVYDGVGGKASFKIQNFVEKN